MQMHKRNFMILISNRYFENVIDYILYEVNYNNNNEVIIE